MTYYHGGKPGLRPGDLLTPYHDRAGHPGCAFCEARARGETIKGIDPPSQHESVYVTTHRLYAKHYASLWGYGDLYRVDPLGEFVASEEDTMRAFRCDQARIVSVLDRAVLLTPSERRRIHREWTAADIRDDPARADQIRVAAEAERRAMDAAHRRLKMRTR